MKNPPSNKRKIARSKRVQSKTLKMIKETVVAQILNLHEQHHTRSSIARITGASRSTVNKYLDNPEVVGHKTGKPSYLEPYRDLIKECFLLCKGNCAAAMELFKEKLGKPFNFKARTFRKFCEQWRDEIKDLKKDGRAYEHYETGTGVQMQTDFFKMKILINSILTVVCGFVAELSFSRRIFCKLFDAENTSTWINGTECAFLYFQGVPASVLTDNAKTLVTYHPRGLPAVLNDRWLQLSQAWHFQPFHCAPHSPECKGYGKILEMGSRLVCLACP